MWLVPYPRSPRVLRAFCPRRDHSILADAMFRAANFCKGGCNGFQCVFCRLAAAQTAGETGHVGLASTSARWVIPIRIKNDNCVASPCRAAALSAASRLVLLSNANWNKKSLSANTGCARNHPAIGIFNPAHHTQMVRVGACGDAHRAGFVQASWHCRLSTARML